MFIVCSKKKSWEKKSELDWRFYSTRMGDKGNDSRFIGTKVFEIKVY